MTKPGETGLTVKVWATIKWQDVESEFKNWALRCNLPVMFPVDLLLW